MNILFISLGCDKNLVDSEVMLGLLNEKGYQIVDDETQADVIVVNTCCFIHDAKEESIQSILEMAEYKTSGNCKVLAVTGCLAQRYQEEITKEIPEVGYVGWDVCLGMKDPFLIEANEFPGHDLYQLPVHRNDNYGVLPLFEEAMKEGK